MNTREAIRVIGYLLETNGTTVYYAKDKDNQCTDEEDPASCKWCLEGAMTIVCKKVMKSSKCINFNNDVGRYLGLDLSTSWDKNYNLVYAWEGLGSTDYTRKAIIEKLKQA